MIVQHDARRDEHEPSLAQTVVPLGEHDGEARSEGSEGRSDRPVACSQRERTDQHARHERCPREGQHNEDGPGRAQRQAPFMAVRGTLRKGLPHVPTEGEQRGNGCERHGHDAGGCGGSRTPCCAPDSDRSWRDRPEHRERDCRRHECHEHHDTPCRPCADRAHNLDRSAPSVERVTNRGAGGEYERNPRHPEQPHGDLLHPHRFAQNGPPRRT